MARKGPRRGKKLNPARAIRVYNGEVIRLGAFMRNGSGQIASESSDNLFPSPVGLRPGVMPKLDLLNEPRKPRVITLEKDEPVSEEKAVPREGGS